MTTATTRPMDDRVPHRGAMSLLDAIEYVDDERIVARVDVPAHGLFATADGVPAWVGIEYMAQAVAAWSGALARSGGGSDGGSGGGSPRIGYLLGCRRYEAHVPMFAARASLRVEASCELVGDNGLGMFNCRITHEDRVLATGRLSVYQPGDESTEEPREGPTTERSADDTQEGRARAGRGEGTR